MKKEKTIDTGLIDRAICFATKAHEGIVRKGSDLPYIIHPLEAMAIVATMTSDQELMAAALLHDVVEDAGITIDEISREFGPRVAELVDAETDREVPGLTHVESWQQRKQATIDRLAAADRDTQMVALGDKLSNMRAMVRHLRQVGDRLWQRFNEKDPARHAWYYRQLAASLTPLSGTDAYREFTELVEQVFPSDKKK
jgi:myo-inositol-1(or 4)-monophosphatase